MNWLKKLLSRPRYDILKDADGKSLGVGDLVLVWRMPKDGRKGSIPSPGNGNGFTRDVYTPWPGLDVPLAVATIEKWEGNWECRFIWASEYMGGRNFMKLEPFDAPCLKKIA